MRGEVIKHLVKAGVHLEVGVAVAIEGAQARAELRVVLVDVVHGQRQVQVVHLREELLVQRRHRVENRHHRPCGESTHT